ncbi:uncharacterized protein LOC121631717 [Melanotaenia boesemani]|uniref:uncharacterized protein LOC121631717 n=1 Tax=Melanotaenia boesemani TaxID=1250792 RepID=UPI001C058A45|nr:uncharacterized protein LOC121631717 [Melanotaenia boesemani]
MTSSEMEVKKISEELKHISLKGQQLEERKKILCIFQELRDRAEFGETEEAAATRQEIKEICDKLKELTERKTELQKCYENVMKAKDKNSKKITSASSQDGRPRVPAPASNVFFVEAPPAYPAPAVILDVENLPSSPTRTQCPECRQFITTEICTSVSSVTWMVCFMTALIGCVAGCCLLPFCMDRFKSTTHRCPKCRTSIVTIKKL